MEPKSTLNIVLHYTYLIFALFKNKLSCEKNNKKKQTYCLMRSVSVQAECQIRNGNVFLKMYAKT